MSAIKLTRTILVTQTLNYSPHKHGKLLISKTRPKPGLASIGWHSLGTLWPFTKYSPQYYLNLFLWNKLSISCVFRHTLFGLPSSSWYSQYTLRLVIKYSSLQYQRLCLTNKFSVSISYAFEILIFVPVDMIKTLLGR